MTVPRPHAVSTRDRILDVTAALMRSAGLTGVTTREIARAAGLTEAALYRHFKSKEDLLTCALAERLPVFIEILKDLPQHVGQGSVGSGEILTTSGYIVTNDHVVHGFSNLAVLLADLPLELAVGRALLAAV